MPALSSKVLKDNVSRAMRNQARAKQTCKCDNRSEQPEKRSRQTMYRQQVTMTVTDDDDE